MAEGRASNKVLAKAVSALPPTVSSVVTRTVCNLYGQARDHRASNSSLCHLYDVAQGDSMIDITSSNAVNGPRRLHLVDYI